MDDRLKVVGLTGGIASGKSSAARMMRRLGLPVIDADGLAHMTLEQDGEAYRPVLEAFGAGVLGDDGVAIDRQRLGRVVFDDPARRAELEAITHPAISRLAQRAIDLVEERGERLAIYEAALLVETGMHKGLAALIVVSCPLAAQLERLVAREGFSRAAAAARIASQLPLEEKVAVADYVIDNGGELVDLEARVAEVCAELRGRFTAGER
ncbi:MAG: dephospho-CoA kinase [Proteobacteria bacterium]|jgi:dephospho-CoA kinase|nr:dephospho-CoA kinase [Pseudomonadota bacterium]